MARQTVLGISPAISAAERRLVRYRVWHSRFHDRARAEGWTLEADAAGVFGVNPVPGSALRTFANVASLVVRAAEAGSQLHRAALAVVDPSELGFISRFTTWNPGTVPDQFGLGELVQVHSKGRWGDAVVIGYTEIGYVVEVGATRHEHSVWWTDVRLPVAEEPAGESAA